MGPQLRNLWVPVGFRLENLPKGRFSGVFALKLRKLHLEVWVISYFIFEPGGSPKTALRSWIRRCFPLKCILATMHVSQRIQFETFYCLLMKHFWTSGVSLRAILDNGWIDGWNPHPNHNLDHRLRTFAAVRFLSDSLFCALDAVYCLDGRERRSVGSAMYRKGPVNGPR